MYIIILDLEATCWEDERRPERMEIIEIGAVKLDGKSLESIDEFSSFVHPILSDFCKELTSIKQSDIDKANDFNTVFGRFLEWIGESSYRIASWGEYDIKQLSIGCKRHGISFPNKFRNKHINIKQLFARQRKIRPCGLGQALKILGLTFEGTHHRAIDDARTVARIARGILTNTRNKTGYFVLQ